MHSVAKRLTKLEPRSVVDKASINQLTYQDQHFINYNACCFTFFARSKYHHIDFPLPVAGSLILPPEFVAQVGEIASLNRQKFWTYRGRYSTSGLKCLMISDTSKYSDKSAGWSRVCPNTPLVKGCAISSGWDYLCLLQNFTTIEMRKHE